MFLLEIISVLLFGLLLASISISVDLLKENADLKEKLGRPTTYTKSKMDFREEREVIRGIISIVTRTLLRFGRAMFSKGHDTVERFRRRNRFSERNPVQECE